MDIRDYNNMLLNRFAEPTCWTPNSVLALGKAVGKAMNKCRDTDRAFGEEDWQLIVTEYFPDKNVGSCRKVYGLYQQQFPMGKQGPGVDCGMIAAERVVKILKEE